MCPECPEGQEPYLCIINHEEVYQCHGDLAAAQASCGLIPGNGVVGNGPAPCDNQTPDPGASWEPGSYVYYDAELERHQIDRRLVTAVLSDPRLLLLDRTRLEWRGGYFEFQYVSEGDFADLLGFESGDALRRINGYPLSSLGELAKAYDALSEDTALSVAIERDDATIVLAYLIVDEA